MNPNTSIPVSISERQFSAMRIGLGMLATFVLALVSHAQSPAESKGTLEGTVYNQASGLPISRAKVFVRGTAQEVLTDDEGKYRFGEIPAKRIELEVSYLGFVSQTAEFMVPPDGAIAQDFRLSRERSSIRGIEDETVVLEKFEVVAEQTMSGQAIAMNEQRHAKNIKNVVAFDEIGDHGQENIGDYVRFLPGVAIIDDGENPAKISLGGFPAEMSNIQVNGADVAGTGVSNFSLPSLESSRTIALQDVPIVNIERVEVSKVPMPDMPASGLGGTMNLITKTRLGVKQPILTYQAYMNFNNKDGLSLDGGTRQPLQKLSPRLMQPSFGLTYVFPAGKRVAISLGASRSWRRRPADDTPSEVAFWNLRGDYANGAPKDLAMALTQWRQEADITITEDFQAGVDWKIAQHDTLSFSVQRRNLTSEKATSYFTTRINTSYDAIGNASSTQSRGATGRIEMGSNNPLNYDATTENTQLSLQYRHRGSDWHIEGNVAYSMADRVRSSIGKGYFGGTIASILNLNIRGDGIGQGASILPETYTMTTATGAAVNPFDGNSYNLTGAMEEYGRFQTDLLSGHVDVTRDLGRRFSIKAGGAYNSMEKNDIRPLKNYTFTGLNKQTSVALYDLIDESIEVKMNGNPVRWISPVKAYDMFVAHPDWFSLNSSAYANQAQNSKRMIEDVSAGYLRFDLRLLQNRLNVIGGVRYEKTKLDGWSMKKDTFAIYQRDAAGNLVSDGKGGYVRITTDANEQNRLIYQERANHESQGYDGFYPSLNVSYAFSEKLVARAAYARTIGRPDVRYVVAGITLPTPTDTNPTSARTIVVGNPGLEPWTADSFHLSLDSYHLKGGFGSVGVYHKDVRNFFAQRGTPATPDRLSSYGIPDEDIAFMLNDNYVLRRWENVGDAALDGFEMSYRQDLKFLPPWLQLTQVWVNYTHLEVGGESEAEFVGFSPNSFSAGINYIRPRFSLRLNCAYQAETKKALVVVIPGTSAETFIPQETYDYQAAYTRYGISADYAFSKKFSIYLKWDNVFAKDLLVHRRAADTPAFAQPYQRYVTPSYIVLGVKGSF